MEHKGIVLFFYSLALAEAVGCVCFLHTGLLYRLGWAVVASHLLIGTILGILFRNLTETPVSQISRVERRSLVPTARETRTVLPSQKQGRKKSFSYIQTGLALAIASVFYYSGTMLAPQAAIKARAKTGIIRFNPILVYSLYQTPPVIVRATKHSTQGAIPRTIPRSMHITHQSLVLVNDFRTRLHTVAHLKHWSSMVDRAIPGESVMVSLTQYCLQGTTRRDHIVRPGIVAADPRVFPLARYVDIFLNKKHLGRFLIDDTGGNVKGATLDMWTASCHDARIFGRRWGQAVLLVRGIHDTAFHPQETTLHHQSMLLKSRP